VTITGTNFNGAIAVQFGENYSPSLSVVSNTQIVALVPAGAQVGKVDVRVTTPSGISDTSGTADDFGYSHPARPTISGISSNVGLATQPTPIVITGSGFIGTQSVTFVPAAGAYGLLKPT
jgi:hypothetical protein